MSTVHISYFHSPIVRVCLLSATAELAENGSIYDYLHLKKENPSLEQSLLWARQVAEGTMYVCFFPNLYMCAYECG